MQKAECILVAGSETTCLHVGSMLLTLREKWTINDSLRQLAGVSKLSLQGLDKEETKQFLTLLIQKNFDFRSS